MANWDELTWFVVAGVFLAFFMAYGIGANDVANAFATSVGSKTLTLFQAVILAAIFEFGGAVLLGRGVTSTVKDGIADIDEFADIPAVFAYGMLCALAAAGTWLLLATYLEMPVSTTHSIIGGIIGFALVAKGGSAVTWYDYDDEDIFPVKGVTAVVISWVFSPVASGIVAAFFFFFTRLLILRTDHSYDRAFYAIPLLVLICIFINVFYVCDKGITKQAELETEDSAWIAAVVAVGCAIAAGIAAFLLKKKLDATFARMQEAKDVEKGTGVEDGVVADDAGEGKKTSSFFSKLSDMINSNDPHKATIEDANVRDMHDHAEVFEMRTENVFRYLQLLTACADAFAHGANDVANAIGPFAAIWQVYREQELDGESEIPIWILIIGGFGIVIGLATYGYTIIKAIGVKLCKITPSRGFCIEMGSALVVVTGSYLSLPLSTTHCQVGATVAVGLLEGAKGVSWMIAVKAMVGWVLTLILVGLMSGLFMALGIFTPGLRAAEAEVSVRNDLQQLGQQQLDALTGLTGCGAGYQANLARTEEVLLGTTVGNVQFPYRVTPVQFYINDLYSEGISGSCAQFNTPQGVQPIDQSQVQDVSTIAALYPPGSVTAEDEEE